jgi:hypothetical protein
MQSKTWKTYRIPLDLIEVEESIKITCMPHDRRCLRLTNFGRSHIIEAVNLTASEEDEEDEEEERPEAHLKHHAWPDEDGWRAILTNRWRGGCYGWTSQDRLPAISVLVIITLVYIDDVRRERIQLDLEP